MHRNWLTVVVTRPNHLPDAHWRLATRTLVRTATGLLFAALMLGTNGLQAAPVDLTVANPDRIATAGSVVTFAGRITNNTGMTLASIDLFLDFAGFDPLNATLDQLLGLTLFSIADGSTSPLVDLFAFTLSATAMPGLYPANVFLQTNEDVSDGVRVTVRVIPEPDWLVLAALALSAMLLVRRRRRGVVRTAIALGLVLGAQTGLAQVSAVHFTTNPPGIGTSGSSLMVAVPITNSGSVVASDVKVTSASLRSASLVAPTTFPVSLGGMGPGTSNVFQADFNAGALLPGTSYLLTVRGTYLVGGVLAGFTVNRFITPPAASPGFGTVRTGTAGSTAVSGAPYPPRPPDFGDEVNVPRPPIPAGPLVPGVKSPVGTGVTLPGRSIGTAAIRPQGQIVFNTNASTGLTTAGTNCNPGVAPASCAEPSGASGGGVLFVTANWTAAYSTDGGSTFTTINPTTIFPADAVGFCCDQVVQYVPSIDRFIWLLQGNGVRIASASPAQIRNSGGTAWTYWNLTAGTFGQPAGTGFDYPDVSVGTSNLFLSWDVGFPACPAGCNSGFEVVRIPLSQLAAGGTIFFDFTTPSDSNLAWGSHLTQDTGDEIFWAGHNGNGSLRVFSLADGANRYFWRDIGISSWPNNTLTSITPDNQDWLKFGFPGSSVIGATRSSNQLWFAWNAGTNNSFQQPHVQIVTLDRGNNFQKTQQVQVWNNSFAFAYPALATNVCTGEVGLSLAYGGNGNYENHAVGIWGDFVVFATTNSNFGVNRYGDYLTIRQNGANGLFDAFGYGVNAATGGGMQSDVRYAQFGRPCIIQ